MKKIILAVSLIALALSFIAAQDKASIKRVRLTAKTLASQPAGEANVIDLTRNGTIYDMAAGIDYSRVRIRTSKGEMPTDVAKRLGRHGSFLLGTLSDMRVLLLSDLSPTGGISRKYSCDETLCTCKGAKSCNDMVAKECNWDLVSCVVGNRRNPTACICERYGHDN